uniref:Uncharacterized protein n=1 Tax=Strongyloides papillosus TaxID=174720 RepID=A0A0N5BWJ7_STREA
MDFQEEKFTNFFQLDSTQNLTSLKYINEDNIKKLDLEEIFIQIGYLRKENLFLRYYKTLYESDEIKKVLDQLEATSKELRKQSEHEKKYLENIYQHSVKTVLQQKGEWDKKSKESNSQYKLSLENLQKSEKELENNKQKNNNNIKILEIFYEQILRLLALYENGEIKLKDNYGYNLKNCSELIKSFKQLLLEQGTFHLARNKWINGRTLVIYSQCQIAFGIKKWEKILTEDLYNEKDRYFICAESKNNFIAAIQNLESCQIYMGNKITFPFVTKKQTSESLDLLTIFFEDVLNDTNARKCLDIFKKLHSDITNLIQWFNNVISEQIMKDLEKNCTEIVKIEEKLHEETKGIVSNKYKDINQKIGNYKKEKWEDEVKKLKSMKFINYDMTMIMNLSKPDDYKNFKNFSLAKEQNLVFNVQQKINQLEAQKIIFENIKKKEIKTQENKLENELTQRKTNKGSYNFK